MWVKREHGVRILFTGGGGAGNEAIWRRFGQDHGLYFADADVEAIDPLIPRERRLSIPFASDPAFAETVLSLCGDMKIDLLVPGVDEELSALAARRGEGGLRILLPQKDFVDLMLDKLVASYAIRAAGLSAPETRPLADYDEISFPLIAKPRSGRGSRGVAKLSHPDQVQAYLTLQEATADCFIAQAVCPGQEYTVFVAADERARLRAVIPVRVDSKKGITITAMVEHQPAILDYAVRFQEHFGATGIYNIQCMLTPEGQVLPFEVNPRISTTFCLAVSTGFDPFAMEDSSEGALFVPTISMHLRRHWKNEVWPAA